MGYENVKHATGNSVNNQANMLKVQQKSIKLGENCQAMKIISGT